MAAVTAARGASSGVGMGPRKRLCSQGLLTGLPSGGKLSGGDRAHQEYRTILWRSLYDTGTLFQTKERSVLCPQPEPPFHPADGWMAFTLNIGDRGGCPEESSIPSMRLRHSTVIHKPFPVCQGLN